MARIRGVRTVPPNYPAPIRPIGRIGAFPGASPRGERRQRKREEHA